MVWDDRSEKLCDPKDQLGSAFKAVAALAEYARAGNLTEADELLTEVLALMVARRASVQEAN